MGGEAEGSHRPAAAAPKGAETEPTRSGESPSGGESAGGRVLSFELELTPDEVLDCWRWYQFSGPGSRAPRSVGIHVNGWEPSLLLVVSAGYLFWLWYMSEELGRIDYGLALILGVGMVLWWIKVARRFRKISGEEAFATQHRDKANEAAREIEQGWKVRVDGDGVVYANRDGVWLTRWRGVSYFERFGRVVVLHTARRHDLFLPTRLIADGRDEGAACELLRSWMLADGGGQEHYVPAYLREHDAACTKCSYNLRGVTALACPECGTLLDLRSLPEAFESSARRAKTSERVGESVI